MGYEMSVSRYVHTYIHTYDRMYIHMSICPQKVFFDFNEIWYVWDRGQWGMYDSMQYDAIQGKGHGAFEVLKIALF